MATLHRGKLATAPKIIAIRPLTRDDLACLRDKRPVQGVVKSFRDWHHRIARLCAAGLRPAEVCLQAGISRTRLLQLQGDPAFQELVASYRGKVDEGYIDSAAELYQTVTANTLNAEVLIRETLEEAMDGEATIPLKTLLAISRDGADRIGLPKQKVSTNTNINLDFAAALERAATRSGRSNVIDAVPSRLSASGAQRPSPTLPISAPQPKPIAGFNPAIPKPPPSVAGIRRRA